MLGALKRRWKPKRDTGTADHTTTSKPVPFEKGRVVPSQRQVHPLDGKTTQQTAYDKQNDSSTQNPPAKRSPADPLPKQPNLCLEAGRIEFIRSPPGGARVHSATLLSDSSTKLPVDGSTLSSLYQQLPNENIYANATAGAGAGEEKCDVAKEALEARIRELERLLEAEHKAGQRGKMAVLRLQRQLARREVAHRDVERERKLREDTEGKFREVSNETERYRNSLASLQRDFNRMEETVRSLLQYKTRCDLLNKEKATLTAAYESRMHQYQSTLNKLGQENESLKHQLRVLQTGEGELSTISLIERLRVVEAENTSISRDSEIQRRQYERCLDDIANQVVRALLSQKGLREEIANLQRRIKELENQNQALANILIHRLSSCQQQKHPQSMENSRRSLHLNKVRDTSGTMLMMPLQRPNSLNLKTLNLPDTGPSTDCYHHCHHHIFHHHHHHRRQVYRRSRPPTLALSTKPRSIEDEGNESPESGNRDEGYSTMSSDVQGPTEMPTGTTACLEDLKESQEDPDDAIDFPPTSIVLYNPRHSFPLDALPHNETKHLVRSFSDSYLGVNLHFSAVMLRSNRTAVHSDNSASSSSGSADSWWDRQWQWQRGDVDGDGDGAVASGVDRNELENWSLSSEDLVNPTTGGLASIKEDDDSWSSPASSCILSDATGNDKNTTEKADATNQTLGMEFTRDFYRLVKYESTKSLISNPNDLSADKDLNLQSVLNFIAEQQQIYEKATTTAETQTEEEPVKPTKKPTKIPVILKTAVITSPKKPSITKRKQTGIPLPLNRIRQETGVQSPPPDVNLNDKTSSKDVIEELNRIIRRGDDGAELSTPVEPQIQSPLDADECVRHTGWVHVERDIDFNDPKARANLLDVMLASSNSSNSDSDSEISNRDEIRYHQNFSRFHRLQAHGHLKSNFTKNSATISELDDTDEATASADGLISLSDSCADFSDCLEIPTKNLINTNR